jgi:integrase
VKRSHKYRHAVLVSAVTGCRPDELGKGIRLSIIGDQLIAEITGSKVTEKSGQPWRRLAWSIDSSSPLVAMLVDEVRNGLTLARIEDARIYSGAVRAAGEREWPARKKKISPYCFRHAAASDLKASGMDDSAISQALGHCADVARSYYGQRQQGRKEGGVAPNRVAAARLVRQAPRNEIASRSAALLPI